MNKQKSYCTSCHWHGDDYMPYSQEALYDLVPHLSPGDIIPTGVCPTCGGIAYPANIELRTGRSGVSIAKIGDKSVIHVVSGQTILSEISFDCIQEELSVSVPSNFTKTGPDRNPDEFTQIASIRTDGASLQQKPCDQEI